MSRIYRAVFSCTGTDGALMEPSVHYQTDVPLGGDEPDPSDVATGIWGHVGTTFLGCFSSYVTCHELVVLEETLPPDIGVAGAHAVGLNGTMSGSGDSLPAGVCPLLNIHTDTRSRSARGWTHMPYLQWADRCGHSAWDSAALSALQAFANLLADTIDLGSLIITHLNPVVYSRTRRTRAESPWTFKVTNVHANPAPKYLRSRTTSP
jgi:hypothetical protein